jgi:hypothetical protein
MYALLGESDQCMPGVYRTVAASHMTALLSTRVWAGEIVSLVFCCGYSQAVSACFGAVFFVCPSGYV